MQCENQKEFVIFGTKDVKNFTIDNYIFITYATKPELECKHPDRSERFLLFWAIRHFEWQLKIVLVPAAPNESAVKGVKSLGERERERK